MKPRVGISRCLLGDDVRYDGTNRLSAVVAELTALVDWVPICPEVEVGMGVPREPIQLTRHAAGVRSGAETVRLKGVDSREDWTDRMDRWACTRVTELAAAGISGVVLKARSPAADPAGYWSTTTTVTQRQQGADCLPKHLPRRCPACR